jgi:predicted metalloendopeptidase
MTLGENLADNGGISLAYEVLSKQPRLRLSGLDMSPEALFFISFGRVWCEKDRPERAVQKVKSDRMQTGQWLLIFFFFFFFW